MSALVAGEVQLSLRESTPEVRERQVAAVRASWMTVARAAILSIGFGLFLAMVGVHTAVWGSFWRRAPYLATISLCASLMVLASIRLSASWTFGNRWLRALAIGGFMTLPMALVVWVGDRIFGTPPATLANMPGYVLVSLGASIFFSLASAAIGGQRPSGALPSPSPGEPVRFLERLPLKLRGAELWAVEAEDHYLRLHTSKGQDLILLRLADAIAELDGLEGAQVHRSWWLARSAMADVKRGDGRATITLKDGAEVPVSRTFAKELRDKGWF